MFNDVVTSLALLAEFACTHSHVHVHDDQLTFLLSNSVEYIKRVSVQFEEERGKSLLRLLEQRLSTDGGSGYFCKTRLLYALDSPGYYAGKIKEYLDHWSRDKRKIAEIFVHRKEIDLDLIQSAWMIHNHGDGKTLKSVLFKRVKKSVNSASFLVKILENSARYGSE